MGLVESLTDGFKPSLRRGAGDAQCFAVIEAGESLKSTDQRVDEIVMDVQMFIFNVQMLYLEVSLVSMSFTIGSSYQLISIDHR